jgi:N-acetylneuraminic acid mutarotase
VTWTGRTLLFGIPFGLDRAVAYDPSANRWNALAPSPAGQLTDSAVAWTGDYLIVTGGSQVPPGSDVGTPIHITAVFNPATNTWTRAFQPPHPVNTGIPVDRRALFPGQPTLAYDPTIDTWSTFPTPPGSTTIWTGQDLWSVGVNRSNPKSVVLYRYQPKQ